tara:strand:- start:158 stop:457 length:300 start_codon:yes stop_codon:yes gene_type:complete
MKFLIYKNKKSPTQSGCKKEKYWVLEEVSGHSYEKDILTGWNGAQRDQFIKLKFFSKKEAIDYATKHQYTCEIIEESLKIFKSKSYADNFKFRRVRTDI